MVKQDGTIICLPAQGWSGDQLNRQAGDLVTTLRNGDDVLSGYADSALKRSFPNLAWTVLVAQDTREAFAATRSVMRRSCSRWAWVWPR
jgi:hypothetical protein